MHPQSIFAIRHWSLPEILFVSAGCFAMAAFGFFLAVFFQLYTGSKGIYANSQEVPRELKEKSMQAVGEASLQPRADLPADEQDALAERKMQLMKSLGSQ